MKKLKFIVCAALISGATLLSKSSMAQMKDTTTTTTERTSDNANHDDTGKWGLLGLVGLLGLLGLRKRDDDRTRIIESSSNRGTQNPNI